MIVFKCEHCRRQVSFDDHWAGTMGRCPACQEVLEIPGDQPETDHEDQDQPDQPAESSDVDELDLAGRIGEDRAAETDILPAQKTSVAVQPVPGAGRRPAHSAQPAARSTITGLEQHRRRNVNLAVLVVTAASVAAAVVLFLLLIS